MDLLIKDRHLAIERGDLVLVDGVDAIRQHIGIRLQTIKGEWFLDTAVGMPYVENILVKNPNLAVVRETYRKAILTTPGVTGIDRLAVDLDRGTRLLSVTFTAQTTDGPIDYSSEVEI